MLDQTIHGRDLHPERGPSATEAPRCPECRGPLDDRHVDGHCPECEELAYCRSELAVADVAARRAYEIVRGALECGGTRAALESLRARDQRIGRLDGRLRYLEAERDGRTCHARDVEASFAAPRAAS